MSQRKETSRYRPTKYENVDKDTRSGIFYFRGTVNGRFVDKSLKTTSIDIAKDRANAIIAAVVKGELDARNIEIRTFDEAFDLVLKIQKPKAEKTYISAKLQIDKHLRPWFQMHCPRLSEFEKDHENKWAEYRLDQQLLDPTRKLEHDRRHLLMALKRAENKNWIKKRFRKKDFDLKEATDPIGQCIEPDVLSGILNGLRPIKELKLEGRAKSMNDCKARLYLQASIAVTMGMRKKEIMHLQKDEIDRKKREINLDPHRLKIRRPRKVPIPITDEVYPLLMAAYEAAPGPYIFPKWRTNVTGQPLVPGEPQDDNRYYWEWIKEQLNIEVRWHDLRHTAITNMIASGLPETFVCKVTGATRETIERVYAHLNQDVKAQFRRVSTSWNFRGTGEKSETVREKP